MRTEGGGRKKEIRSEQSKETDCVNIEESEGRKTLERGAGRDGGHGGYSMVVA